MFAHKYTETAFLKNQNTDSIPVFLWSVFLFPVCFSFLFLVSLFLGVSVVNSSKYTEQRFPWWSSG